jgi:plasmid stabilization system protein ParE
MSRLVYTQQAIHDLMRLKEFLETKKPAAYLRSKEQILRSLEQLQDFPQIGKPVFDIEAIEGLRELIVKFGVRGYVIRYQFDQQADQVIILCIKHQLEQR